MKIVSWNCQGAFRKKNDEILNLESDVVIIQECENPTKLKFGELTPEPNDYLWFGTNSSKGVLIYCRGNNKVELIPQYSEKYRYLIPVKIIDGNIEIVLFAIWAMDDKTNKHRRYIGQIWEGLKYYKNLLKHPSILIGDFNSNKIWDSDSRIASHTDMTNLLNEQEIFSMYHSIYQEKHGEEKTPTFHLQRNLQKPYHIDFCYASKSLFNSKSVFEIGKISDWINMSDHVPIIIEIGTMAAKGNINISLKNVMSEIVGSFEKETQNGLTNQLERFLEKLEEFEFSKEESLRKEIISYGMQLMEINDKIRTVKQNEC